MSYDLMVFDLKAAPSDPRAFLLWYDEITKWEEGHSYDDPAVCGPELQAWFHRIVEAFPAMNGPYAVQSDASTVTDYSVAKNAIYAAFSWSLVEPAYHETAQLASQCGVGFFDVSGPAGSLWRPNKEGVYEETMTAGLVPSEDRFAKYVGQDTKVFSSVDDYIAELLKERSSS